MRRSIVFVIGILLISIAAAKEQIPILPQDTIIQTNYTEGDTNLINVDNMKKSDKVKQAELEAAKYQAKKINLDIREINHQRALNYTTRFNDSMMLPTF